MSAPTARRSRRSPRAVLVLLLTTALIVPPLPDTGRGNPSIDLSSPLRALGTGLAIVADGIADGTGAALRFVEGLAGGRPGEADASTFEEPPAADDPRIDAGDEQRRARDTGARVEMTALRTDASTTYVNPDGTFTVEMSAGPIRVRRDGIWAPLETDLVADGAHLRPDAALGGTLFSRGGTAPVAELGEGSRHLAVRWPTALPAPAVRGSSARYTAADGVDVEVTALPRGFEQFTVLTKRPSSEATFRLAFDLTGLTLERATGNGLRLVASDGTVVAQGPAPRMWGTGTDEHSGEPLRSADVDFTITQTAYGTDLTLRPSRAFLDDPGVAYPVTIDPLVGLANAGDTWIENDYSSNQNGSTELRAGTFNGGSSVARSFVKFDTAPISGKNVLSASLKLYEYHSYSCTPKPVTVYHVTSAWNPTTITWSTSPQPSLGAAQDTQTVAYGYSTSCPDNWVDFDLGALAQAWANGTANHGVQVRASETDSYGWKRFYSSAHGTYVPSLSVNYNTAPGTASSIVPVSGTKGTDTTPVLSGLYNDADSGDSGYLKFEVYRDSDSVLVASGNGTTVAPGVRSSWTVPSGKLVDGTRYRWHVQGYDGVDYGAWNGWAYYTPDTSAPKGAVTAPANGATVAGVVTVTATPSDGTNGAGVASVKFYATSLGIRRLLATDTNGADGWTASFDTATVPDGLVTVSVDYADTLGNVAAPAPAAGTAVLVANSLATPPDWQADADAPGIEPGDDGSATVSLPSGALVMSARRHVMPGAGVSPAVDVTYNSAMKTAGPMGPGWRSTLEDSLVPGGGGTLTRIDGAGREEVFIPAFEPGLTGRYYNVDSLVEPATFTRIDPVVDFDWAGASPAAGLPANYWSARWTGFVDVPTAGDWTFYTGSDDGTRLWVDGVQVAENWGAHAFREVSGTLTLPAGLHSVVLEYSQVTGVSSAKLSWSSASMPKQIVGTAYLQHVVSYASPAGTTATLAPEDDGRTTLTNADGSALRYLSDGRIERYMTAHGEYVSYAYNANGRMSAVCENEPTCTVAGAVITATYDTAGRLAQLADTGGRSTTYSYGSGNRVASETNAEGEVVSYTYTNGRITAIASDVTATVDATAQIAYDAAGRVVSVRSPEAVAKNGPAQTCAYDTPVAGKVSVTSAEANARTPVGAPTVYTVNPNGTLASTSDSLGTTTFGYDAGYRVASEQDPAGKTATWLYDAAGNLLEEVDETGAKTTYTYDAQNRRLTETEPQALLPGADPARSTTTYTYGLTGLVDSIEDGLGHRRTFSYNVFGQKVAEVSPEGNEPGANPLDFRTTFTYDAAGNLASETDPKGVVTTYVNDAAGRLTSRTVGAQDPAKSVTTTFTYDDANRLLSETNAAGTTTHVYDRLGRETATVKPLGNVAGGTPSLYTASVTFDLDGRPTQETDELGRVTTSTYDWNGNLLTQTDANSKTTTYTYNTEGQRLTALAPDGGLTAYRYNLAGQVDKMSTPTGDVLMEYDPAGRLLKRTDAEGNVTTFTYNAAAQLVGKTDPLGHVPGAPPGSYTTKYVYDELGRLATVIDPAGQPTVKAYDAAGHEVSETDVTGAVRSAAYDGAGRLVSSTVPGTSKRHASGTVDTAATATSTTSFTTFAPGPITAALTWPKNATVAATTADDVLSSGQTRSYTVVGHGDSVVDASATFARGQTTTTASLGGTLSAGGSTDVPVAVSSTHAPITGSADWGTYQAPWSANGSVGALGTQTRYLDVAGQGAVTVSLNWDNGALTAQTHLLAKLYSPTGTLVATSSANRPSTLSYTVAANAPTGMYSLVVTSQDLAATWTATGTVPAYADIDLVLLTSAGTVVASDTSTARPATLSYTPPAGATGTYTLRVIASGGSATYTGSVTAPVLQYPQVLARLYEPNGSLLTSAVSTTGAVTLPSTSGVGGSYRLDLTSQSSFASPSAKPRIAATSVTLGTSTGTVAASGTNSTTRHSDGAGTFTADLDWARGATTASGTFAGSFTSAGQATHQVAVSSAHVPISGSVDWTPYAKPFSAGGSVAPLGSANVNVPVQGPGAVTVSLNWDNGTLTSQTHLAMKLLNPSGGQVAQGTKSLSYQVPSSGPFGTYTLVVTSQDLGATYSVSGSAPAYADLNLALVDPNGTVLASDTSTSARPAQVTYQPGSTATGTYTFRVTSTSAPTPSYTLTTTYPVLAHADVVVRLFAPGGQLLAESSGRPGRITYTGMEEGDYRIDVVNRSTAIPVPSYTLETRTPTSRVGDLVLDLIGPNGAVLAHGESASPVSVSYDNAPPGTYALRVTARGESAAYSLDYTIPSSETTTRAYDSVGRVASVTDANGTTTYGYDRAGRLLSVAEPSGATTTFGLDANGGVLTVTDPSGVVTNTYDRTGRIASTTDQGNVVTTFGSDYVGNVTSITRLGVTATLTYDGLNRLLSRSDSGTTIQYTDKINRTDVVTGGETDHIDTDGAGRVTAVQLQHNGGTVGAETFRYTYDASHRPTRVVRETATSTTELATFGYDTLNHLTSETTNVNGTTRSASYTYDAVGNRRTATVAGAYTSYAYSAGGQLVARTASGTRTVYLYDSVGRLVTAVGPTSATTYSWTDSGKLSGVTGPGVDVAYTYDANGLRLTRRVGSATSTASYVDGRVVSEKTGSTTSVTFTYDDDGAPLTMTRPGVGTYTFHYDGGGSVIQLTNSAHAIVAAYTYDAWGNVLSATGDQTLSSLNPYRYRARYGATWDGAVGLYMFGARVYDPVLGRFLSRDPAEATVATASYTYADSSPVALLDTDGLMPGPQPDREGVSQAEALTSSERSATVRKFFKTYRGSYASPFHALGYGEAIKGFVTWERQSGRFRQDSHWWRSVNGEMMLDLQVSYTNLKKHKKRGTDAQRAWYAYGRAAKPSLRRQIFTPPVAGDLASAHDQVRKWWRGHQKSLHHGLQGYWHLYYGEIASERHLISLVVLAVDRCALTPACSWFPDTPGVRTMTSWRYPDHYPAPEKEVSQMKFATNWLHQATFGADNVGMYSTRW